MGNHLSHKGYLGTVEYNAEDQVLHGQIMAVNDLVTYEATDVTGLRAAFEEAVEDYLDTCAELGKEPDKVYQGVFNVRTSSQKHRALSIMAKKRDMKLNEIVNKAFDFLVANEDKILA